MLAFICVKGYVVFHMSTRRILFLAPAHAVTRVFPQLRDAGYEIGLAENIQGASAFVRKSGPGVIFARPTLPGFKAEDLLSVGQDDPAFPPVIIIVEKGTAEEAQRYMELGAADYWLEPLNYEKIVAVANTQQKKMASPPPVSTLGGRKPSYGASLGGAGPKIVGQHPVVQRVMALARQVAPSKATVLINGESGTGKELFSRALHQWSNRAQGPFVAVNCAALPEHLLESELFGHEKGAFTGAIARKLGKFELASGGTILLDEISEMELALQAKLLRVLQEGEVDRVGGTDTVRVDVRVLATTNRHLEDWVKEGKFRQDLYFRLNVIPLRLPSLRERGDDVLTLAQFFMDMYSKEYVLGEATLAPAAVAWLREYDFPGNVRELQNLMERAVLLANGRPIEPPHFLLDADTWPVFADEHGVADQLYADQLQDGHFQDNNTQHAAHADDFVNATHISGEFTDDVQTAFSSTLDEAQRMATQAAPGEDMFRNAVIPLHEMERIMILKGLEATSGNRTQAAELLGISVRTLRNKLNEYRAMGIEVE